MGAKSEGAPQLPSAMPFRDADAGVYGNLSTRKEGRMWKGARGGGLCAAKRSVFPRRGENVGWYRHFSPRKDVESWRIENTPRHGTNRSSLSRATIPGELSEFYFQVHTGRYHVRFSRE